MSIDLLDLSRWVRMALPHGAIGLREPTTGAALCIRTGPPPLRRFRVMVEQLARASGLRDVERTTAARRLVTDEGEHAVVQAYRVRASATTQPWSVAMVVADSMYRVIDGTAPDGTVNIDVIVERVACGMRMGLGADRARWPVYVPPPAWLGARRALATCWLPPGAPRDPARLIVGDAVPIASPIERTQTLVWFGVREATSTERVANARLTGELATAPDGDRRWARAVLSDGVYRYRVELQRGTDPQLALLSDIVTSLEPIPGSRVDAPCNAEAEAFAWIG